MRRDLTRMRTRENKLQVNVRREPKFEDRTGGIPRINPDCDASGLPVFEVFVRRRTESKAGLGAWVRMKDIQGDEMAKSLVSILEGEIEGQEELLGGAEGGNIGDVRLKLSKWIKLELVGSGMGGNKLLIDECKAALPKFKKLRHQDFQFGYRVISPGQNIFLLDIGSSKSQITAAAEPAKRLDAAAIAAEALSDKVQNSLIDVGSLMQWVRSLDEVLVSEAATHCVMCCDGSATMGQEGCIDASAGLVVLPMRGETPLVDAACCLEVRDIGGFVDTPFDSELIAALAALTVASLVAAPHDTIETLLEADPWTISPSPSSPLASSEPLPVEILSDSRAVLRALRKRDKGRSATDDSTLTSSSMSQTRRILLELCMSSVAPSPEPTSSSWSSSSLSSSSPAAAVDLKWVHGHPERRYGGTYVCTDEWSMSEVLVWNADNLASGNLRCEGIFPVHTQSLSGSSLLQAATRMHALRMRGKLG